MQKKIIITAPAGAIDPVLIDDASKLLQQWGFAVQVTPHAKGAFGRFSATEDERLSDFQFALESDADFILCARGGYGVAQIIDRIRIPQGPSPVVIGFSDITALHSLLGNAGKRSIHGSMCKDLAEYSTHRDADDCLHDLLLGRPLHYSLPVHPLNRIGQTEATLRGGNLSLIYSLQQTPFACPVAEGDILFIEDIGEHPYAIDRMMQNLRLSGILSRISGLIVGQFSDMEEDPRMPYTVYEGIRRLAEPYDYPILFNFPAGHVVRNLPLILNAPCKLVVREDAASFEQN